MSDTNYYDPSDSFKIPITIPQFRRMFPAFGNSTSFPDEMLEFWFGLAYNVLNRTFWGSWYNAGLSLFVAHQVVLEAVASKAVASGGIPGLSSGIISSKSINGVSISFDSATGAVDGSGDWNMSLYGRRFIGIARLVGSPPTQIIGADAYFSPLFNFGPGTTFFTNATGSWMPS